MCKCTKTSLSFTKNTGLKKNEDVVLKVWHLCHDRKRQLPDPPNMSTSPLVSIVIPVFNGANYMRQAIDSALAQTYPQVEVLVVNDGSTDNGETERIAGSYGERIRYFAKENGGVASALNRGLREMRGSYFAWLSHDDAFLPEKTSRQVGFLRANRAFAACYTDYLQVDPGGAVIRRVAVPWRPREKALKALFARQYINGSTVMVQRECFDRVGIFDEKLRYTQDMEMWFRLLQHYEFGRVPWPLARQRVHPEQGSRDARPHQRESRELLERLFADLGGKGLLDKMGEPACGAEQLARRHVWFGLAVSRGRGWYDLGSAHLEKALALWPSWRNPARFYSPLSKLTPLLHRLQKTRVHVVHWLMKRVRALPPKH